MAARCERRNGRGTALSITEEWLEIVDGRINGQYTTTHQGVNYYRFHYRGANCREIDFEEDLDALSRAKQGCKW